MNSPTTDLFTATEHETHGGEDNNTALKTMLKSLFPLLTAMLLVNSSMMMAMQSLLPMPALLPSLSLMALAAAVLFVSLALLNRKNSSTNNTPKNKNISEQH